MLLRIFIYLVLAAVIYWGVRSIVRDWKKKFKQDDVEDRKKAEAKSGGVVNLERGEDGVYRPGKKD
jgi:hypothetical protein